MTGQIITNWTMIQCVRRELQMRHRVYPRRVEEGRMKQSDADREIREMNAVYETLQRLEREESAQTAPSLPFTDTQTPISDR